MDLLAYLEAFGVTYRELEARSGVPFPVLNAIAHGKKGWSPEVGLAIVEASDNKISLEAMAATRRAWLESRGEARPRPPAIEVATDTS